MNRSHLTTTPGRLARPLAQLGLLACTYLLVGLGQAAEARQYTSIKPGTCKKPKAPLQAHFEGRGLGAEECSAPAGTRIFAVSTDERSWLEIGMNQVLWSTEEVVVHQNTFGHFPNLGADQIEWQLSSGGQPSALIFRIAAQDPERPNKNFSRLFVLRFADQAAYFCGVAKTNEEARTLAASPAACTQKLKSHPLS